MNSAYSERLGLDTNPTRRGWWLLLAAMVVTVGVYAAGLSGGFLFDDYPNIVDNPGVQPHSASVASLTRAALSSPSSAFKRPLASLSFAANYLISGLDPFWMKLTNLVIHLLNGLLLFLLARVLLRCANARDPVGAEMAATGNSWQRSTTDSIPGGDPVAAVPAPTTDSIPGDHPVAAGPVPTTDSIPGGRVAAVPAPTTAAATGERQIGVVAAVLTGAWMLLPINLTAVLYVVQRMESMANAFVLLGLLGYVVGRRRMLRGGRGLALCVGGVIGATVLGMLAKETAVMLPLYAFLIEWLLFGFMQPRTCAASTRAKLDMRVVGFFVLVLLLPLVLGLIWLLPGLLNPGHWATRDFTLQTRLLSEARIVAGYIAWTLLPTAHALSFYHDDFVISTGLLSPWTTLASMLVLLVLAASVWGLRRRAPLVALGLALFLGCHLLTGTILSLELIYEHRNYFASIGLLLAIVPLLAAPPSVGTPGEGSPASRLSGVHGLPMALPRYVLLGGLLLLWTGLTALTSLAWSSPLSMAQELASRAPCSPRAQYELGRTYIVYSHYDPDSMFTRMAYAPLERSAALPDSSILAEQALIFMNARMHLPLKDAWWDSMIAKLKAKKPGVQDESSLGSLTQCVRDHRCDLPKSRMVQAFTAALAHPHPRARLLAIYADYAWNVLDDHALGDRLSAAALRRAPNEPAYYITRIRMLAVQGRYAEARKQLAHMQRLNIGGRLDGSIAGLSDLLPAVSGSTATPATSTQPPAAASTP